MSKVLIEGKPTFKKSVPQGSPYIDVAEFFCDTIQGEGVNVGVPATFLRVQHCTQVCIFCDSSAVWRHGNPYTFEELFQLMEGANLIERFKDGQHLVLTGGSPMKQQYKLIEFIDEFVKRYGFKPYIEIENECVLMPEEKLMWLVDCWNNSPKLENSYNPKVFRYQPNVIKRTASIPNSWFKFVVSSEEEWEEIKRDFLDTNLIKRSQIILMPLGATQAELIPNREKVVEIAIRENVRYCTREHIMLWDKMTGV